MREPDLRSGSIAATLACALVAAGACTPFDVAQAEFDAVAGLESETSWPAEVDYDDKPMRPPWGVRAGSSIGLGFLFRILPEFERSPYQLENPSEFARSQLATMVARADNVTEIAETARRLLWVAELDVEQPLNQALGLRGITHLMELLGMDPTGMRPTDPNIMTRDQLESWEAILEKSWPATRPGAVLPDEDRADYLAALQGITSLPHPSSAEQRVLIGALERFSAMETDPALVEPTRQALFDAMYHGLSMGLLRGLYSRAARVREVAIHSLHRLSGPDSVPFVLALITKPSSVTARGNNRYDDDVFVRLALVRLCGQLDPERALASWGTGPAPAEFLYETLFADPDQGLRAVALEALARCLDQPISTDSAWAERWWRNEYVPNRGARSPS